MKQCLDQQVGCVARRVGARRGCEDVRARKATRAQAGNDGGRRHREGGPSNRRKLKSIGAFLALLKHPWIRIGDLNATKEELDAANWPQLLNATGFGWKARS